jgi:hypothetical protein
MNPELWEALNRWASQELRSVNGQIEWILRQAVAERFGRPSGDDGGGEGAPPEP